MKKYILLALLLAGVAGVANASEEDGLYNLDARQTQPGESGNVSADQTDYTAYDELSDDTARTAVTEVAPTPSRDDMEAVVPGANWPEGT